MVQVTQIAAIVRNSAGRAEIVAENDIDNGTNLLYESIPRYRDGVVRPVAVHVRITRLKSDSKGRNVVIYDKRLTKP